MPKSKLALLPLLALALALSATATAQQPAPLFNGKNLDGWVQRGGKAKYTIENGEIVGTTVPDTPNSFLCTAKNYGDFILEFDFKADERLNSGVQIRSECFDTPKEITWNGKTIKIAAGRVHGYQVEIDPDVPRARLWSAGIYDEGRRGWLFPLGKKQEAAFSEQGLRIFKPNDWNHVRVEATGDSIKTWLNGTPCADISDSMTPRGFIALQVHAIGKDASKTGLQVRWRNLTITSPDAAATATTPAPNTLTDAEKAAGWRLLWDGKTTDGWRSVRNNAFPAKGWTIKDGVLSVQKNDAHDAAPGAGIGGDIITRERFSDFELLVDFKIPPRSNSGIKYFIQAPSNVAFEYQILDDARHPDAKAGRDGNRKQGSLYDLIAPGPNAKSNPIGEWNTARIVVRGNHVEHWLNGQKILEFERGSPAFLEHVAQSKFNNTPHFGEWRDGHILLQDHGDEVFFRNIKILVPAK